MSVPPIRILNPAGQISAGALRRLAHTTEAQDRIAAGRNILFRRNAGGLQLNDTTPQSFWAQLTSGSGAGPWAWQQMRQDTPGVFTTDSEGRVSTTTQQPAYEAQGISVTVGSNVRLRPDPSGDWYVFDAPANSATALTVRDTETIPVIVSGVTTLQALSPTSGGAAQGLVVTDLGSGTAQLALSGYNDMGAKAVSSIALPLGGLNFIPWDTTLYDTYNFRNVSFPTRLTIPVDGKYYFFAYAAITNLDGTFPLPAWLAILEIWKNGAVPKAASSSFQGALPPSGIATASTNIVVFYEDSFVAGDYLEYVLATTFTTGQLNIGSYFGGRRVA